MDLQLFYQHLIEKVEQSLFHLELAVDTREYCHIPLCQFSIKQLEAGNYLSFHSKDHYSLHVLSPTEQSFLSSYKACELNFDISLEKIEDNPHIDYPDTEFAKRKSLLSFSSLILESPEISTGLYRIITQLLYLPHELEAEEGLFLFQEMDVLQIFSNPAVKK